MLSYSFPDCSFSYIVCVCNHYSKTNQNLRLMMVRTNHLSLCLWRFSFLLSLFFFYDVSDNYGSWSGSSGTCAFPLCSEFFCCYCNGIGSGVFVPTGIKSIFDVVLLVVFVPIEIKSKVGRLIQIFSHSKSWISLIVLKWFLRLKWFFAIASITLSAVAYSISLPDWIQLEPFVGLLTLVVGTMTNLSLSLVMTCDSPKLMKFGFLERTVSLPRFIQPYTYTSTILSVTTLLPITSHQVGLESLCLAGNRLMEASSGSAFLASYGMMDYLGPSILWLPFADWGGRGYSASQNLSSGSGGYSNIFFINWNWLACVLPIYQRRIFDNT